MVSPNQAVFSTFYRNVGMIVCQEGTFRKLFLEFHTCKLGTNRDRSPN